MSTSNPTQNAVHVSAVICTRNRPDKIGQAVASVLANDYPNFELTVIDQSTTDATEVAIRDLLDADPRLHYIHSDEPGLSRAYNNGIGRTTGEILAFTDDDCIVPTDWIQHIATAFESEPDGDLLYGQVVPAYQDAESGLTPSLPITEPDSFEPQGRVPGVRDGRQLRRPTPAVHASRSVRRGPRRRRATEVLAGLRPRLPHLQGRRRHPASPRGHAAPRRPARSRGLAGTADGYGIGDGAFYTKHVRCRDPYALWLLTRRLADAFGRVLVQRGAATAAQRRPVLAGHARRHTRRSFKFERRPPNAAVPSEIERRPMTGQITILGAGPTGLGAAYRLAELGHDDWDIYERTDHVGGLASSYTDEHGFIWDHGGHVMFSHYTYFDDLVEKMLRGDYDQHMREAWVWMYGRFVPYPFQNNIHRLPPDVVPRLRHGHHRGAEDDAAARELRRSASTPSSATASPSTSCCPTTSRSGRTRSR